jgi:pyrimidine-nucleoside phosphorylase
MLTKEIIEKKRDGLELSPEEIRFIIQGVTNQSIPDYQISAWLMAVLCSGMSAAETAVLTESMLSSGQHLRRCSDRPRVDKHSTGGLGDKTSLILAPVLACLGFDVPMLSGRGLGITGGTLDKMQAYPGYRCDLSELEISRQIQQIGCVITGTTPEVAPADRRLYAIRDVTGTVPSVALITGSIMSKKLAESLDGLVLDVKWGSGAFMKTQEKARQLEASLVSAGSRMGVKTSSLLTDMNQPLGRMVGNACEANEAIHVLQASGPQDLVDVTLALGAELLVSLGCTDSRELAKRSMMELLQSGQALRRYQQMIEAQGGRFQEELPIDRCTTVESDKSGWLAAVDGARLGNAVIAMGGGRRQQTDTINPGVGLEMLVRLSDRIEPGQPLVRLFYNGTRNELESLQRQVRSALTILSEPVAAPALIVEAL